MDTGSILENDFEDMPELTDSESECELYDQQVETTGTPTVVSEVRAVVVPESTYRSEALEDAQWFQWVMGNLEHFQQISGMHRHHVVQWDDSPPPPPSNWRAQYTMLDNNAPLWTKTSHFSFKAVYVYTVLNYA